MATSADGTRIAWYRYGEGERTVLFVPTWNLVDARVVGHQVVALEPHADRADLRPPWRRRQRAARERLRLSFACSRCAGSSRRHDIERAAIVTASRGLNAALLLVIDDLKRFDRIAAIAPAMRLEPDPAPPDPERLEALRSDWRGFIVPFMHAVFTEPDSDDVIAEMIEIGLEATPDVIAIQEAEVDWERPARLLGQATCPALVVHGEADAAVPVALAESIVSAMPNARLEVIPGGGHRPDIRSPELVNPLLLEFLLDSDEF
jgi:pimeloyl-ACP methyl ester carboxylesterase